MTSDRLEAIRARMPGRKKSTGFAMFDDATWLLSVVPAADEVSEAAKECLKEEGAQEHFVERTVRLEEALATYRRIRADER